MYLKKARFAAICCVSRASIGELVGKGTLHVIDGRIDLSDPVNLSYLAKHNSAAASEFQQTGTISGVDPVTSKPKATPNTATYRGVNKKLATIRAEEHPEPDDSFDPFGGLNGSRKVSQGKGRKPVTIPDSDEGGLGDLTEAEIAETLRKPLYDARKAKMEAEIKAVALDTLHHSLGEREEFDEMIQALWHAMQLNYIDVAPKQAALVCKRLGMAGRELDVIEVIEADIKKRQDNVAKAVDDVLNRRLSKLRKIDEVEE